MDRAALKIKYDNFKKMNLDLDLTRGKPSVEQLNLSNPLMSILKNQKDFKVEKIDIRNYGEIDGLPLAKKIGSLLRIGNFLVFFLNLQRKLYLSQRKLFYLCLHIKKYYSWF